MVSLIKTIVKFSEICLKQSIRTRYILKYLFTAKYTTQTQGIKKLFETRSKTL